MLHTLCNIRREIIQSTMKFYLLKVKNLEDLISGQEIRLKEGMKHYQAKGFLINGATTTVKTIAAAPVFVK